jgi:hypothetical protein
MKTLIAFIFSSLICFLANAQSFAIINDKDDFVNVRKDKSINSPIVGKIYNDSIFGYDPDDKSDWLQIYKQDLETQNGYGKEGYIYKNRIFPLSKFRSIKNIKSFKDSCVAINDSLIIIVKSGSFNPKKHKLTYSKPIPNEHIASVLTEIDGKQFWGTDGDIPKKIITAVTIIKNGVSIIIPKNAFNDLYEPWLKSLQVYIGKNNTIYIEMDNSDGAGAYSIIWIIKNNHYLKKYIDNSNA